MVIGVPGYGVVPFKHSIAGDQPAWYSTLNRVRQAPLDGWLREIKRSQSVSPVCGVVLLGNKSTHNSKRRHAGLTIYIHFPASVLGDQWGSAARNSIGTRNRAGVDRPASPWSARGFVAIADRGQESDTRDHPPAMTTCKSMASVTVGIRLRRPAT